MVRTGAAMPPSTAVARRNPSAVGMPGSTRSRSRSRPMASAARLKCATMASGGATPGSSQVPPQPVMVSPRATRGWSRKKSTGMRFLE